MLQCNFISEPYARTSLTFTTVCESFIFLHYRSHQRFQVHFKAVWNHKIGPCSLFCNKMEPCGEFTNAIIWTIHILLLSSGKALCILPSVFLLSTDFLLREVCREMYWGWQICRERPKHGEIQAGKMNQEWDRNSITIRSLLSIYQVIILPAHSKHKTIT